MLLCFWMLLLFTLKGRMTALGGRKTKSDFRNEKYRIDYPTTRKPREKWPFVLLKQACAFRLLNAQIYHNLDPLFKTRILTFRIFSRCIKPLKFLEVLSGDCHTVYTNYQAKRGMQNERMLTHKNKKSRSKKSMVIE